MFRLRAIGITAVIICFVCLFGMVLTPSAFAFLVAKHHAGKNIDVVAGVYIDRLEYDPTGEGVVYLDGSFNLMNYNEHRRCTYTFEVRLEIFKWDEKSGQYEVCNPDAKTNPLISGTLDKAVEPWENYYDDGSDNVYLHIPCLNRGPIKHAKSTRCLPQ